MLRGELSFQKQSEQSSLSNFVEPQGVFFNAQFSAAINRITLRPALCDDLIHNVYKCSVLLLKVVLLVPNYLENWFVMKV